MLKGLLRMSLRAVPPEGGTGNQATIDERIKSLVTLNKDGFR